MHLSITQNICQASNHDQSPSNEQTFAVISSPGGVSASTTTTSLDAPPQNMDCVSHQLGASFCLFLSSIMAMLWVASIVRAFQKHFHELPMEEEQDSEKEDSEKEIWEEEEEYAQHWHDVTPGQVRDHRRADRRKAHRKADRPKTHRRRDKRQPRSKPFDDTEIFVSKRSSPSLHHDVSDYTNSPPPPPPPPPPTTQPPSFHNMNSAQGPNQPQDSLRDPPPDGRMPNNVAYAPNYNLPSNGGQTFPSQGRNMPFKQQLQAVRQPANPNAARMPTREQYH